MPRKCSCGNHSIYNVYGQSKPICCKICKTAEMINVKSKKCPCGTQPCFNVPGQTIGICCKICKTDGMINVVTKRCPCGSRPYFNVPAEIVGICCAKCKTGDMVDVVTKRCICGKQPSFNMPTENIGVCCMKCKTSEMVDVVSKICPGYNTECPVRTRICRGQTYCMSCDPNDARRKRYKRFEDEFFDYIKDKLDVHKREFQVTFNPSETTKKYARIDGIVFGDGVIVCIEVDENGSSISTVIVIFNGLFILTTIIT